MASRCGFEMGSAAIARRIKILQLSSADSSHSKLDANRSRSESACEAISMKTANRKMSRNQFGVVS